MAPRKYNIRASKYPYKGYPDYYWEGDWFFPFAVHFICCLIEYPIVDTMFRACKRMEKEKSGARVVE